MARLTSKAKLTGSTMIEVVVASVIFLSVFFLAMDMLVRIGTQQPDDVLIQVGIDEKTCIHEFTVQPHESGEYIREYEWGEITVTVSPYRELSDVAELQFISKIKNGNRTFSFRTLKAVE